MRRGRDFWHGEFHGERTRNGQGEIADFVMASEFSAISDSAVETMKRNVLDSLACALAAVVGEAPRAIRQQIPATQPLSCDGWCASSTGRANLHSRPITDLTALLAEVTTTAELARNHQSV
ncbi:MmgE/PrpD family protein [Saccharopolyspora shandongensis]|uniref:MmgE/PrpD family protein n=1 Tax=Saccharopolyspora shandongensis TaxID=418495 RepID=UPI003433BD13